MRLNSVLLAGAVGFVATTGRAAVHAADLVIYGSSPAAISAAVQAKRMGVTCIVVSPETRIGGLTTGGLGQTDIGNKSAFGGIALDFYRDVAAYYRDAKHWCQQKAEEYSPDGQCFGTKGDSSMWTFEPHAALEILEGWERRDGLDIRRGEYLDRQSKSGVEVEDGRIKSIKTLSGNEYRGKMFVDATYEGDLMAAAGVSYHVGREANALYGETISGIQKKNAVYHQIEKGVDPYVKKGDPKSGLLPNVEPYDPKEKDGDGDRRVQAYCFRMCLTDVPENRIPFKKPANYDERDYELLFRHLAAKSANAFDGDCTWKLPWINSKMPNRKTDTNNRDGFSTDFIGRNWAWPEASYAEREKILREHLDYQRGLMWTLANHPRVPENVRAAVSKWGTCKDEFTDGLGDGWQSQLYVREARRMVGDFVMTEHHCRGKAVAARPVAMAAYTMDSHNVRRHVGADGFVHNEGDVQIHGGSPYPIDYGAIVPKRTECGNLFVPVCLSASHMAFGSIRMEPVFFALGQVAGTAAALAIREGCAVQDVSYPALRKRLRADGQVLSAKPLIESLNGAWQFRKEGEAAWRTVEVPHDWAIEGPFKKDGDENTGKLPWVGVGHYRRTFAAEALQKGRRAFLEFDGVMASPKVKVNGVDVGGWDYGYMGFRVEITKALKEGENIVEVTADTRDHKSRWYPGAGIYRDVRFAVYRPEDADPTTVFIRTPSITPEEALVAVTWKNFDGSDDQWDFKVRKPRLWDVDDPYLYTCELRGQEFRYGIRTIELTTDGLHLNGRRVQLQGVCNHADLGPLGMAFNRSAARRQLEILKDMGVNALRTSHNCPAPQLLDLCDEMGILVWDECFDKWDGTAGRCPDQKLEDYVVRNLDAFVRRDRNHPCVFCYSTGNEIPPANCKKDNWGGGSPDGHTPERNALFAWTIRAADPTRATAMGCSWTNGVPLGNYDGYDLTGWNYTELYQRMHARKPFMPLVYSESASALSGYGEYATGAPADVKSFSTRRLFAFDWKTKEVDSYDSLAAPWSDIPDVEFARMERDRFVGGEFVWTGIDYLGEPTPWSQGVFGGEGFAKDETTTSENMSRSSYFGIVDLCGIPKDRYYLYRSHWNVKSETTHLVPQHWNWESGAKVPVFVYTSGDEAELFLNGKSLGRRKKGTNQARGGNFTDPYYAVCDKYRLMWFDVPFAAGELKAVSYRDGRQVGTDVVRTCGKLAAVRLTPEAKTLPDDGESVVFVQVDVTDEKGVRDPRAENRVSFAVAGPAKILAVGNGNARGLDSFKDVSSHPLYKGKAVVVLRRDKGAKETVTLTASADGLKEGKVAF